MNRIRILSIALVAMLCVGFASCEKDEADEPQSIDPSTPNVGESGVAVSHEVDLGLSVNWAAWNIGASMPDELGGYFAWGETEEKNVYDKFTYKFYDSVYKNSWCDIGNVISGTEYDVAHVKWGNGWRMPTREEFQELLDSCTWDRICYKGVNGDKITGPNGNSIFIPAGGYRYDWTINYVGRSGVYWSGTVEYYNTSDDAWYLDCNNAHSRMLYSNHERSRGLSVRAVRDKRI